jgi:L-aminopeptidase/D-esterase-like protein
MPTQRHTIWQPDVGSQTPRPIDRVSSLGVGHAHREGRGWRTGTTVVAVPRGAIAGVDVRGAGPGTRETDLLRPEHLVQQVHAVVLTGGSAFGLAAADGVMGELEIRGHGFPVGAGPTATVVPIVPAAVIFDLGRGGPHGSGDVRARPDAAFGALAARRALTDVTRRSVRRTADHRQGSVGAGVGAIAGGLRGGVGTATTVLAGGANVTAVVVVNSVGSVIDPSTGLPWECDGFGLRRPRPDERRAIATVVASPPPTPLAATTPLNTTIGVIATDASLTASEATRLATVGHDGLARAIRPVHTMFDGDVLFGLSTAVDAGPALVDPTDALAVRARAGSLTPLFEAGARCVAAAVTAAVLSATSTPGSRPTYRDLCPSAFGGTSG